MGKSLIKEDFDFNEMKSSEGYLGAFVGKVKVLINIQDIPLIVMNFSKCVHMLIDDVSSEKECEDFNSKSWYIRQKNEIHDILYGNEHFEILSHFEMLNEMAEKLFNDDFKIVASLMASIVDCVDEDEIIKKDVKCLNEKSIFDYLKEFDERYVPLMKVYDHMFCLMDNVDVYEPMQMNPDIHWEICQLIYLEKYSYFNMDGINTKWLVDDVVEIFDMPVENRLKTVCEKTGKMDEYKRFRRNMLSEYNPFRFQFSQIAKLKENEGLVMFISSDNDLIIRKFNIVQDEEEI